jgi:hypothetical protein
MVFAYCATQLCTISVFSGQSQGGSLISVRLMSGAAKKMLEVLGLPSRSMQYVPSLTHTRPLGSILTVSVSMDYAQTER